MVLTIYDMKGQAIRTLAVGHQPSGLYRNRERAAIGTGGMRWEKRRRTASIFIGCPLRFHRHAQNVGR